MTISFYLEIKRIGMEVLTGNRLRAEEPLPNLRAPTFAPRPAFGSRLALLGGYMLLWFPFQAPMGKAGTLAHILRQFVGRCFRLWR